MGQREFAEQHGNTVLKHQDAWATAWHCTAGRPDWSTPVGTSRRRV